LNALDQRTLSTDERSIPGSITNSAVKAMALTLSKAGKELSSEEIWLEQTVRFSPINHWDGQTCKGA
jgi:hypothetical protein